ncbi:MAG: hypothetical protein H0Z32_02750 [Bacillaceae bacterium]|nr:hypothetical protein [Bacillaceae bacterium]
MKKIWLLLLALLITSGVLLSYQWSLYSNGTYQSAQNQPIVMKIDLQYDQNNHILNITQSFQDLFQNQYKLNIPEAVRGLTCMYKEDKNCLIKDQNLIISPEKSAEFTYKIPLDQNKFLSVHDWYISLQTEKGNRPDMNVYLSIPKQDQFLWFVQGKPFQKVEKEYVNFYEWKETIWDGTSLIRIPNDYPYLYEGEGLLVFSVRDFDLATVLNRAEYQIFDEPVAIVYDPELPEKADGSFVFVKDLKPDNLKSLLLKHELLAAFSLERDEEWIAELAAAVIFQQEGETEWEKEMIKELENSLSPEEIGMWFQSLANGMNQSQNLSEAVAHSLGEIMGGEVPFFRINEPGKLPVIPMYISDHRDIYLNGVRQELNWTPVVYHQNRYYPLGGLAMMMGMDLYLFENQEEFVIQFQGNTYRLYLNKDSYIKNEQNFGITRDLLVQLNDDIYISEPGVRQIFNIGIQESDNQIAFVVQNE